MVTFADSLTVANIVVSPRFTWNRKSYGDRVELTIYDVCPGNIVLRDEVTEVFGRYLRIVQA
jgi:predicted metal-binding protein